MEIDISKADKAAVLAALFNASSPRGMGMFQAGAGPKVMTVEDARKAMESGDDLREFRAGNKIKGFPGISRFDYLYGRPLKIDLSGDVLDARLYNRDNPDALDVLVAAGLPVKAV